MPKALPTLVLLLVGLSPALGQTDAPADLAAGALRIEGPVSAAYGVRFVVKGVPQGYTPKWTIGGRSADAYFESIPNLRRLYFADAPGRYTVTVEYVKQRLGGDKPLGDYKPGDEIPLTQEVMAVSREFTLTGGVVPPGPGPLPPPPVPPPVDPLAAALKAAAAADAWPAASLRNLATGFRACADLTARSQTAGDMQAAQVAALKSAVPKGVPPAVYAVCSAELRALDAILPPSAPDKPLTDADRTTAKALFLKLGDACQEAAK